MDFIRMESKIWDFVLQRSCLAPIKERTLTTYVGAGLYLSKTRNYQSEDRMTV